jgi:hypothetical protein
LCEVKNCSCSSPVLLFHSRLVKYRRRLATNSDRVVFWGINLRQLLRSEREMNRSLQRNLLATTVTFAAVALLVAIAFANGVMSPRLLGVVLLLLVGGLSIAVTLSLKRAATGSGSGQRRTATETSKIRGSIRRLQTAVVVLPVFLITGLWMTRGGPLFPRITGAAINIFFTLWFISLIRRAKKQLP